MDARRLEYPEGCFDGVFAPYVMSVVPEPEAVMAEMRRVLRPGGRLIVVNRFSRGRRFAPLERRLSPLTQWLGFRLDLRLSQVTDTPGLKIRNIDKINMAGQWRLIAMDRVG